jgi:hypothetical protein
MVWRGRHSAGRALFPRFPCRGHRALRLGHPVTIPHASKKEKRGVPPLSLMALDRSAGGVCHHCASSNGLPMSFVLPMSLNKPRVFPGFVGGFGGVFVGGVVLAAAPAAGFLTGTS